MLCQLGAVSRMNCYCSTQGLLAPKVEGLFALSHCPTMATPTKSGHQE